MPKCKACDADIHFVKVGHQWQATNADGADHLTTCRYPELFERDDLLGIVTLEETAEGWSFQARNRSQGLLGQGQFRELAQAVRWSLGLLEA